ncbi:peptidase M22 [Salipiger aestuarii]|uniref:tRNA threonylcarbamoyl adenosine modification protein YeaZ n=1 Tax=Salipiger aestuarii TaxID=568098 RepID=A0A327YIN7_9RHOB|nr:tRNA (adenosine(37)-N6)-threonylcarbamoyltransferase complex dimerization subunit type 1 TsaB [Salipiger aestuarii]EIE51545.1 protease, putative [Citreicella sp. 357]KAA8608441.1 peptidase M22 [Salipiger aestuarii]KAA8612282.1 peptidase M22 [Salipiger aestuarii]KAB2541414.1 peptidase M22 [Salipiger aestuarii]RAK20066.1 tRNA threonylcarbamoyl adenosine modification protein YeaZ [Salipiger aestuarii]
MKDRLTLGFDSSAAHCAAALLKGDTVLARRSEDMSRGQAERLMPLLEQLLASQGLAWADLHRIGVGTGPGNFTGIRIAVAAARGLSLSLDIPALGITTFEAIRMDADGAAAVPAPRGLFHVQGRVGAVRTVAAEVLNGATLPPEPAELAARIARLAASGKPGGRPAPLYLRPADAAPSRDTPPAILT